MLMRIQTTKVFLGANVDRDRHGLTRIQSFQWTKKFSSLLCAQFPSLHINSITSLHLRSTCAHIMRTKPRFWPMRALCMPPKKRASPFMMKVAFCLTLSPSTQRNVIHKRSLQVKRTHSRTHARTCSHTHTYIHNHLDLFSSSQVTQWPLKQRISCQFNG